MQISFEKPAKSQPLPERIDTGKATISKPELIEAFIDLQDKKDRGLLNVAEQKRLGRLKKYGDNAPAQNKIIAKPTNRPTLHVDIKSLNKAPQNLNRDKAQKIIDLINDGQTFIKACEIESIRPKAFLEFIEENTNLDLKQKYFNARVLLAEWYIEKRERLEQDLLSNKIDSATYSTLANDYKYLAGKLAPLAYGDKITLDAQINKAHTLEVINGDKIKELNSLINSNIIDCDYQIENKS